jgi:hypothetical protein
VRVLPAFLVAALVVLPAACGERKDGPGPGAGGKGRADTDLTGLSRGTLSARVTAALDRGDFPGAEAALDALIRDHGGAGELPDGRTLSPEAMVGAVFESAVERARRQVDGPAPDRGEAERALAVAERRMPGDETAAASLALARAWVGLRSLDDVRTPLAQHDGPRVLAVADDFDLGEMLYVRSLRRWSEEGGPEGLRVAVVPMLRGWVRVGIRRTRAKDKDEERRAVAARLAGSGVVLEPEPPDADAFAKTLGLSGQDAAVLVFDRAGRLVARLSGRNFDPAVLDTVVQKVTSR